MNANIEISLLSDGFELIKQNRNWQRDLTVMITTPGSRGVRNIVEFPKESEHLIIQGLDSESTFQVDVGHPNRLRRILRGTQKFEIQPGISPFRVLITGSDCCGKKALADYLNGLQFTDGEMAIARHDTLSEHILPWIWEEDFEAISRFMVGQFHNIESASHFSMIPELVEAEKVVHLVRDGRLVCQSSLNRQLFDSGTIRDRLHPNPGDSGFEKACHFWRHTNEQVESISHEFVRLEDLAGNRETRWSFLERLGLQPCEKEFPHTNKGKGSTSFKSWSPSQKSTFTEICGEKMDQYYPQWRETW
jgi:hypothetical protein